MAEQNVLKYSIYQCSSHSASFVPENVLTDNPNDGTSRWSSESNNPPQFLTLKLYSPSVVQTISFGKYEKSHVCNMKKFKVYGGLSDDSMIELLDGGLKNNNQSESFNLKHTAGGNMFACRFIKIVPIQSWGPSFNFSIWHVQLRGIDDWSIVRSCVSWFNYKKRLLYIFAGQRSKEYLSDFFTYNVDTDKIEIICDGKDVEVPPAGFTQRATIDPDLNEIHVLSGSNKDKREEYVKNSFWVYDISLNKWSCIYQSEIKTKEGSEQIDPPLEPCPRFAHQLVYDHIRKVHYLFGGNPGKSHSPKMRLDDFWSLHLYRPTKDMLVRQCRRIIRQHKFQEIADKDPVAALHYLQTELANTVDHSNHQETKEFQLLAFNLFSEKEKEVKDELSVDETFKRRSQLFDQLTEFFPDDMTQPKNNLIDLISLVLNFLILMNHEII
ncbi:Muskelin like protein [Argiope bruennichi]|uniref:Muskelin like protein n=1 Tax=Argiope bruennichi TaxID=94029 RepID=A0A8T0FSN1_ARGBR|nr:Muskelin like protein [Argiope bruennichi]